MRPSSSGIGAAHPPQTPSRLSDRRTSGRAHPNLSATSNGDDILVGAPHQVGAQGRRTDQPLKDGAVQKLSQGEAFAFPWPVRVTLAHPAAVLAKGAFHFSVESIGRLIRCYMRNVDQGVLDTVAIENLAAGTAHH
jgi:hypothetical protein